MDYFFKSLSLGEFKLDEYEFYNNTNVLTDLSKLNIFVGSNNSGKSRFIRKLIGFENYYFQPSFIDFASLNESLDRLKKDLFDIQNKHDFDDVGGGIKSILSMENFKFISSPLDSFRILETSLDVLSNERSKIESSTGNRSSNSSYIYRDLNEIVKRFKDTYDRFDLSELRDNKFTKVYIPTLRGLRPFEESEKNYYKDRTLNDYQELTKSEIFTGQDLYTKIKGLLLGNLIDRKIISDYQNFLSQEFFNSEEITIIPSEGSDVVSIKIGNEMEQPIHLLGDGIQSIIIITFPLFLYKNENLLLFIEEPELYLHPGFQRKLVEIITDNSNGFNKTQIFITTHSNHFLDITFDFSKVSIYRCKKNKNEQLLDEHLPTFMIENLKNEDSSILELLGVQNSSVYLSNCTIWVEGITDRMYIKRYLDVYLKEEDTQYREDYHYSFIEYSGNNITHWSFLENEESSENNKIKYDRISQKVFLITDYDGEEKKSRHETLKEKLGESYYCLDSKEIENTLSEKVLEKVIREYEKDEEGEIFKKVINIDDYKKEYIGSYIEKILIKKQRVGSYSINSGTITDKLNFCKKSLKYINNVEDLSNEGRVLCEKLVTFIEKSNS